MRVGLISDTHDRLTTLRAALALFERAGIERLIHPGDIVAPFAARLLADFPGALHVTFGNNDGERAGLQGVLPQITDGPLFLDLEGRRVLVHHFIDWCTPADLLRADVVITGHTHQVAIGRRPTPGHRLPEGLLLVNPGECCGWVTGRCTVAILDLATEAVEILEVAG